MGREVRCSALVTKPCVKHRRFVPNNTDIEVGFYSKVGHLTEVGFYSKETESSRAVRTRLKLSLEARTHTTKTGMAFQHVHRLLGLDSATPAPHPQF